jgi:murein DD-endopeptidase MepM/ murein hydrolase activator NlpD
VQGREPKTPDDGAPQSASTHGDSPERRDEHEGTPDVAAVPVESEELRSPDLQTPQAASLSRSAPEAAPETEKGRTEGKGWRSLSPLRFARPLIDRLRRSVGARVALTIAGGAAAILGLVFGPLAALDSQTANSSTMQHVGGAALAASIAATEAIVDGGVVPPVESAAATSSADAEADAAPAAPSLWRVSQLAQDPAVSVVSQTIGHRPLLAALAAAKVSVSEAQRITKSLALWKNVDRLSPKDELTVALDKETGRVIAYEFASSPLEVWQGREQTQADGTARLETQRLDIPTARVRVGKAVLVGSDLRASFADAGLTPVDDFLSLLDDALDGHTELSDIRPGARLRMIATQEQVDGNFVRWVSLEAVEYFPASPNAPPVRVYSFGEGEGSDAKKHHGWYDARARQPFHGGFRSPVPLARIASRFNPHRMHPVLHIVMPHNGVDFAAPIGAPVYATAAGVVTSVGNGGPCGNMVEISHAGGITSVYCHLSRFASGLRAGLRVEQRQLIAYVGQTGRVTGPHLHFGIKKNGVFVDPMTLRLDGVRVVPRTQRDEFDRLRAELDAQLDGIPLPATSTAPVDVPEPEVFYEEP